MKNLFKPRYIPLLALGGGVLGFMLRLWLFATGIDEKGLILTGHPANSLLFLLTAAVLLGLYLCLRPLTGTPTYKRLFKHSRISAAGCWVGAFGILVTESRAILQPQSAPNLPLFLLGIVAAVCLGMLGLCRLRGARPRVLIPGCITVYLMFHLVSQYRGWSAEPQLQVYVFPLLASICLMLRAYHRATLDARSGSRRWYVFFNYSALFFSCLALCSDQWSFYLAMAVWTATSFCSLKPVRTGSGMHLPKNVLYCMQALEDEGHSAYAVGGCVRDSLLGIVPHDYDLCTSATPEQTARIFAQHALVRSGEKHGTIGVVLDGQVYEITTFRTEGGYSDCRHPDQVTFVNNVEADLARRDFTVNAIAYSPALGYIDPFGGQEDLRNNILRTVGDPEARFSEDALRILRGVRFAARFGLTPEAQTEKAMLSLVHLLDQLAPERVFSEICNLLMHASAQDLIRFAPVLTRAIPELASTVGFQQHSPHHAYDVYTHTAHVVEATPKELPLRLAALLHDIGKPDTFTTDETGRGHFYGHAKRSAEMADDILLRLRSSNTLRERVVLLIEQHMTPFEPDKRILRRWLGKYGDDAVVQMLALQRADFCSKGVEGSGASVFEQVEQLLTQIRQEGACLTVKDLAINGHDLLALGVEPGPRIGECMTFLLQLVQDELLSNTREDLMMGAKDYFENN